MSTEIEGAIRIIETVSVKSKFEETIYIGLSIKSKRSEYKIVDWQKEKEKQESIRLNYKKFVISKEKWYHNAEIFVVPTKVFGKTKLEVYLKEHFLLGTGYEIGIYHRDNFTPFFFTNSESMCTSMGGTITIFIEWKTENINNIVFKTNEEWLYQEKKKLKIQNKEEP